MGTYILRPVDISVPNTGWEARIASLFIPTPTDPELIEAVTSDENDPNVTGICLTGAGTVDVTFTCNGLSLYLDGSPTPIDTLNIPPGWTVQTAHFIAKVDIPNPPGESVVFSREGFPIHTSTVSEDVDVDLGVLTNLSLFGSSIGIAGDNAPVGQNIALNNVQIAGDYIIETGIVLSPSGGDVEPGQSITATGPRASELEYAALNGDQVIPIIPKVVGPNEVILEVPSPDPACDDCFDDCTECEDCLTACSEDLTGEECQACLDACLDCLTECLDDLEAAETCQEAVNDPADPTPITIICQFPGPPFSGVVPLGDFDILVAEASGIYQLVDGKEEDTLYTSERDGTTYDVKIPNPNGKTGFFRS